ncbi:MAG TPA: aldehyde dehydrogenase family protein [Thermoanaerobaculia bacterium]|nr:aldehyde dehydrogenase family protein [Thermoanaerobaculia bacterium]
MSTFDIIDPATTEVFASIEEASADDVDRAARAAEQAFESWKAVHPRERGRMLLRIAASIRDHAEELARAEARNVGKPLREARDEVSLAADCFEYYAGTTNKIFGQTIPAASGGALMTFREPVGICAIIVPWNFPMAIASWKVAPALAMGNCVLLKPAEQTPITAMRLGELALQAGIPEGVFRVIPGAGATVGEALIKHPLVRKIAFTGSTEVGARVMQLAAPEIKRVSLELGGKSADLVFDDCDFDRAVASAVSSSLGNAGQDCCARSRIVVQKAIYDRFSRALCDAFANVRVGDPLEEATEMGPLVTAGQRGRVQGYIDTGKREGATLATGGDVPWERGWFLRPTVFLDVKPGMRIAREEIFGPVVAVLAFDSEADAVRIANDSHYGLSGSIWTRDAARAFRVARAVQTGNLSINSGSSVHLEAPFGGVKRSGVGREMGMQVLEHYTEWKTVFLDMT